MVKGYAQKGVDYEETISPTTKWGTIFTFLFMETQNGWKFHQIEVKIEVKTAFLSGDLK